MFLTHELLDGLNGSLDRNAVERALNLLANPRSDLSRRLDPNERVRLRSVVSKPHRPESPPSRILASAWNPRTCRCKYRLEEL